MLMLHTGNLSYLTNFPFPLTVNNPVWIWVCCSDMAVYYCTHMDYLTSFIQTREIKKYKMPHRVFTGQTIASA